MAPSPARDTLYKSLFLFRVQSRACFNHSACGICCNAHDRRGLPCSSILPLRQWRCRPIILDHDQQPEYAWLLPRNRQRQARGPGGVADAARTGGAQMLMAVEEM